MLLFSVLLVFDVCFVLGFVLVFVLFIFVVVVVVCLFLFCFFCFFYKHFQRTTKDEALAADACPNTTFRRRMPFNPHHQNVFLLTNTL